MRALQNDGRVAVRQLFQFAKPLPHVFQFPPVHGVRRVEEVVHLAGIALQVEQLLVLEVGPVEVLVILPDQRLRGGDELRARVHGMLVEELRPPCLCGPGVISTSPVRGGREMAPRPGPRVRAPRAAVPVQDAHVAPHHGRQGVQAGGGQDRGRQVYVQGEVVVRRADEFGGHARILDDERNANAARGHPVQDRG